MNETPSGIRDELAGVRDELAKVSLRLQDVTTHLEHMADHEVRIRALETAQARNAWLPVIVTSVLMSTLGAIVVRFIDLGI